MKTIYILPIVLISLGLWISCGDKDPIPPEPVPEKPVNPDIPDSPIKGKEGFIFEKVFTAGDDEVGIISHFEIRPLPHHFIEIHDTVRLRKGQYLSFSDTGDACVLFRMWSDTINPFPSLGDGVDYRIPRPGPIAILGNIEEKVYFAEDSVFSITRNMTEFGGTVILECDLKNQKIYIYPNYRDKPDFVSALYNPFDSPFNFTYTSRWNADNTVYPESGLGIEESPFFISFNKEKNGDSAVNDYTEEYVLQGLLNTKVYKGADYGMADAKVSAGDIHRFLFDTFELCLFNEYTTVEGGTMPTQVFAIQGTRFFNGYYYPIAPKVCRVYLDVADLMTMKPDNEVDISLYPKLAKYVLDGFEVVSPYIVSGIEMYAISPTKEECKFTFLDSSLAKEFLLYIIDPLYSDAGLFTDLCRQFFATYDIPEEDHAEVLEIIRRIPDYIRNSSDVIFGFSYHR